jgi:hypothetical protein
MPTGCEIKRQVLCASGGKFLKLGRKSGSDEFSYDLRKCAGPELSYIGACASSPNQIFPLRPGAKVFANIEYEGGARIPFEFVVTSSAGEFETQSGKWAELEPMRDDQPFAAASLGTVWGPIEVFLGAGGCYPDLMKNVTAMLYDIDGRGLIEASSYGRTQIQFAIPHAPKSGRISIAFDDVSGQRIGPFAYRTDIEKIVRASARTAEQPRLSCTWTIKEGTKQWYCVAPGSTQLLSWLDVRSINYGSTATALTRSLPLAVTAQEVINVTGGTGQAPPNDSIARLEVPAGWSDLYYQLVLAGKDPTPPIRVPMQ